MLGPICPAAIVIAANDREDLTGIRGQRADKNVTRGAQTRSEHGRGPESDRPLSSRDEGPEGYGGAKLGEQGRNSSLLRDSRSTVVRGRRPGRGTRGTPAWPLPADSAAPLWIAFARAADRSTLSFQARKRDFPEPTATCLTPRHQKTPKVRARWHRLGAPWKLPQPGPSA